MTPSEAADLLALAAAYDQRTVGHTDALAWGAALIHIDLADAKQAVVEHYQRTRDRLMPTDVIIGVRRIRTLRLQAAGDPAPDADPDDAGAYRAALASTRHAIASGAPTTRRPVAALTVGRAVPRPDYGDAPRKARELLDRHAREQAEQGDDPEVRQRRAEARAEVERLRQERATADGAGS